MRRVDFPDEAPADLALRASEGARRVIGARGAAAAEGGQAIGVPAGVSLMWFIRTASPGMPRAWMITTRSRCLGGSAAGHRDRFGRRGAGHVTADQAPRQGAAAGLALPRLVRGRAQEICVAHGASSSDGENQEARHRRCSLDMMCDTVICDHRFRKTSGRFIAAAWSAEAPRSPHRRPRLAPVPEGDR
jgi:hypothetical protein